MVASGLGRATRLTLLCAAKRRERGHVGVCAQVKALGDGLTSFVGRRRELAEVTRVVGESRLVTLTGVGGVGKTRLALRAAERLRGEFPDGVWLVELAKVTEPALLANVVAESLGVRDQTTRSREAVLLEYLEGRRLLLIMDNCEHLLSSCATLIAKLCRADNQLVVLATSREALGILGERTWPVPPLSMPDLANVAPSRGGYVYGHEALDLFEERARTVLPGFCLDTTTKPTASQLCQGLDGLPLAIELAAVRLRSMSIEQIHERLRDRYRLLSSGNRGGPARHQTLRAAVDWSYDLCTEQERALWMRLAIFAGGFDLEAAESVCAFGSMAADDVVELLTSLVDKSIVLREGTGTKVRYRMLETIRAYGKEKLGAAGLELAFARRYRDHYLSLADTFDDSWFGADQFRWWDRIQAEQANLWAVLDFCLTTPGEEAAGLHLVGALCFYWNACGHLQDGRYWIGRALRAVDTENSARAKALWVNGYIAMTQGDNAAALRSFDECVTLAEALGDEQARSFAFQFRGSSEQFTGNLERAEPLLMESVEAHRSAGRVNSLTVLGVAQLAFVSCLLGETERAIALCEECRLTSEAHGERWAYSWAMWVLGLSRWTRGEHAEAASALKASLEVKDALNDRLGMSACVELLAWIAVEEGCAERASRLFGIGRASWAEVGDPLFGSQALVDTHDRYEERARTALGERAFEEGARRGEQLETADGMLFARADQDEEAGPHLAQLTRREREVARLVAAGLTNKEIAARLVISQRTVEGHVENVLGKMGVKSRTQVAIWFTARAAE